MVQPDGDELLAVITAAAQRGVGWGSLSEPEAARVAADLAARYAGLMAPSPFMWEHFAPAESVLDPEGWRWIGELAPPGPVLLLFERHQRWHGLELPGGDVVGDVLGECPGFEPFLTDPGRSFVACHNHHDFVVVAGAACAVLCGRRSAQAPRLSDVRGRGSAGRP